MPPRPLKRAKRYVRHYLVRLAMALVGLLPVRTAMALGSLAGRLAFALARGERRKSLASLALAFPDLSPAERERTARASFAHLGALAGELCCLRQIDPILERWAELPEADRALLESAVAQGKGVLFVSGHVGNFELLARRIARDFPSQTIAKEASDARTTRLIEGLRASGHVRTIWRGHPRAAREMLRALRSGELLGMLIDQDTRVQGVFVDFFGTPAHTPRAAADLALRTGAAVVCGFIARKPDGTHRVSLTRLPVEPTGDRERDCHDLTQQMTRAIEDAIRREPHAWVWMHQRWKTRPDDSRP